MDTCPTSLPWATAPLYHLKHLPPFVQQECIPFIAMESALSHVPYQAAALQRLVAQRQGLLHRPTVRKQEHGECSEGIGSQRALHPHPLSRE